MKHIISKLLAGDPVVAYLTRRDLLLEDTHTDSMQKAAAEVESFPGIQTLIQEIREWPGPTLKNHKDAKLLIHKLAFLAELGFTHNHAALAPVIENILANQSDEGPFTVPLNIPRAFGGSGEDQPGWMLCDAGVILYVLVKMGLAAHEQVARAILYLMSLVQDNGWPCAADRMLGAKFKGPGKKSDPCPYANLLMLRVLSVHPQLKNSPESIKGIHTLLDLWDKRKEKKPFLFAMGTDFCKLKFPFVWYDILFALDTLSRFDAAVNDSRVQEMYKIVESKMAPDGCYKAESVWQAFKTWDFGQKRTTSCWITLVVYRIARRLGNIGE